jgi:hypothetical protein
MDNELASIEQLGLEAAQAIAGADAIGGVRVAEGVDWTDQPTYTFTYLVDFDRIGDRLGHVRMRIAQKLRDELIERADEHYPHIRTLNRHDWD